MTILVVDDAPLIRHIIFRMLRTVYPQALPIPSGSVADVTEALTQHEVTAIMTDFYLPDGTALDILATAQAHHTDIPVVVMSADTDPAVEAVGAGAVDFLAKPFDMPHMVAIFERLRGDGNAHALGNDN